MPWGNKTVEELRLEVINKIIHQEDSVAAICREYNISRTTAYKWLQRYQNGEGFSDRSHTPKTIYNKTSDEQEQLILKTRDEHPAWGARKLHRYLKDKGYHSLPAVSTISDILKRNNRIDLEESPKHTAFKRFEMDSPNELWQMDFKGHFAMDNGKRCHPLTILDDHSRFSLCVQAKENEQYEGVRNSLIQVFQEFGMPRAILCDNGRPWGDSANGYTPFEIWMMQLNILPIHGKPMHPQTQGKEERFHRTMKNELLKYTIIKDLEHAQKEFDVFRYSYNYERPHEALDLDTPSKHYKASKNKYDGTKKEPEYDEGCQVRKVNHKGYISIRNHRYYLSESFIGKYVGLEPVGNEKINLYYGNFIIAQIDLNECLFTSRRIFRR